MLDFSATSAWLLTVGIALFHPVGPAHAFSPAQNPLSTGQEHQVANLPNVVFILTDDQDVHLRSLSYQPFVKKHLIDQGLTLQRHYCTVALCCPSRVSLWTGKAAHNTNVTDVLPPYGKY